MKNQFMTLLSENKKEVDIDKVDISFNANSIDIMDILEDGSNGYGKTFYSVYEAYDYLKSSNALI